MKHDTVMCKLIIHKFLDDTLVRLSLTNNYIEKQTTEPREVPKVGYFSEINRKKGNFTEIPKVLSDN